MQLMLYKIHKNGDQKNVDVSIYKLPQQATIHDKQF